MKLVSKSFLASLLFFTASAFAAGQLMTEAELTNIEKQGKSAIISVHADWCSTCKSQDKVFTGLMKDPEYKNVTFYQVEFDTQKDLLKTLKVRSQSTVIVYKNGKEVVRATGDTKEVALSKLARQAI
ncbi:thioredoxin family protein [Polynucleobacter antarcticus]|uniref:Thioredoxin n=1 Tax=Polynucleobacter antarcticus TaxID=1743162 RepID=A0A6M9PPS3_9BURK|nr:thioredoxin family protein [Polynucleobacter antarcticus]QKM62391.1 thioredoxin [Polynucleobacter antarcticus]